MFTHLFAKFQSKTYTLSMQGLANDGILIEQLHCRNGGIAMHQNVLEIEDEEENKSFSKWNTGDITT